MLHDASSLQWSLSGEVKVERPTALRCVDDKIYVVSCDKRLQLLSREFDDTETLLENEKKSPSVLVEFSGELLVYFESTSLV